MTRTDSLIVLGAILLTGWLYSMFWSAHENANSALVQVGRAPARTVPLDDDRLLTVAGPRGNSVLEIQQGRIRFRDSACKHKFCVLSGWLSGGGESAACLPNRISIMVTGGMPVYDAINF